MRHRRHTFSTSNTITLKGAVGSRAVRVFLALWVCCWGLGEAFAFKMLTRNLGSLVYMMTGEPAQPGEVAFTIAICLFLLLWLAGWTVGGLTVLSVVGTLMLGRDPVPWLSAKLPWTALIAAQRAVAETKPSATGEPTLPVGWEYEPDEDGSRALRRVRPRWLPWGETHYQLHAGALSRVRGRGEKAQTTRFDPARVRVQRRMSPSGVPTWRTIVEAPQGTEELIASVGDPQPAVQMARWLAERSNMPLDLPEELRLNE